MKKKKKGWTLHLNDKKKYLNKKWIIELQKLDLAQRVIISETLKLFTKQIIAKAKQKSISIKKEFPLGDRIFYHGWIL